MPAPFVSEARTAVARAADEARDWERDREAWNLPRAQSGTTIAPIAGEEEEEAGAEDDDPEEQDASPAATPPEPTE